MQASFKAPDQDLVQSSGQAIAQASSWRTILFNVGTDLLMLYLVLALCITLRWLFAPSLDISLYAHLLPCLLLAVPVYGVFDLYPSDLLSPQEELRKLTQGTSIIYLVIFALTFFLRTADEYSRLALLFAWRALAKLRNSASTNLLIFDEILDSSLDSNGLDEFMKII